jgi:hypothetical protein
LKCNCLEVIPKLPDEHSTTVAVAPLESHWHSHNNNNVMNEVLSLLTSTLMKKELLERSLVIKEHHKGAAASINTTGRCIL